MDNVSIAGLDIAKNSFHADGAAEDGSKVFSKALPRGRVLEFFGRVAPVPWPWKPVQVRITGAGSFPDLVTMSG
jgi:hypothetical protein